MNGENSQRNLKNCAYFPSLSIFDSMLKIRGSLYKVSKVICQDNTPNVKCESNVEKIDVDSLLLYDGTVVKGLGNTYKSHLQPNHLR